MTWVEVLPVGAIMSLGVLLMAYGLDKGHRAFHNGKPHRHSKERVDYHLDTRDEQILDFRVIKNNPRKLDRLLQSVQHN
ncbi:hypothetical protein PPL_10936 [Heterostelium album PN500]|uniref:NADH dehydrogenase [ubiquinone] 1 alpha subcomplex subunit 1 n=1 Tax=Heterostelium pallidum (strain ATCC 26659 / Pp 5 / PN500) TaxID=670386 RepID=D3BSG8_HETP5|nr:hypothetical protein PPL_10936 [Heterostelium album PN500]EFA75674.1 hypothetical protein PPL_10936 [Heterostelium album PN500]|eukprot:XP_020427808.1 hypothetical protein PPL_10936 [Heterostelium album PN500]